MSILFDDASSEYLEVDSTPLSGQPLSFSAWFNTNDLTTAEDQALITVADKDVTNHHYTLRYDAPDVGEILKMRTRSNVTGKNADIAGVTADEWLHALGTVASDGSDRDLYFNGSTANESTTIVPAGMDRLSIGRMGDSTPGDYWSGLLAEIAIWNIELAQADANVLNAGYSALFVKPQNLVFYLPMININDLTDRIGGLTLTAFNTPVSGAHPPIIYPAPVWISAAPIDVGIEYISPFPAHRRAL